MVTVRFFARIREQLGVARIELVVPAGVTVAALRQRLADERGEYWDTVLGADNVICARNQAVCDLATSIVDGDEIAFYPPVSGG